MITLSSTFLRNLQKTHASFDEVSQQQFLQIQLQYQQLRSLIYHTMDPPTFLGDKEERAMVEWLKTEKASFITTQRSSRKASTMIHNPSNNLTQEEEQEIQDSTEVFKQLLNGEIDEKDIEDDTESPNFSLGFDFMALCR